MDVMIPRGVTRVFTGDVALRRWLWVSLVCNMGIIVTGAVVRLTGSGLGCPTWPECFEGTYVPHAEAGLHGAIEFGNRLLTFVLILAALGAFISAWVNRGRASSLWWLTLGIGIGIPFQGVIGGITVLTQLNPWVVALHLLLSVALIVLCVWALRMARGDRPDAVGPARRALAVTTFTLAMISIWLGTIVTGAGPHAGDADAPRNGLEIVSVARLHSLSAWVLLAASVASVMVFRAVAAHAATRASWALLATVALQGVIGYIQYFAGLPVGVVIAHMVGLTLITAAAAWLLFATAPQRVDATAEAAPALR